MTGVHHDKLVRDRIPEIIAATGMVPITHVADDAEYLVRLRAKLTEEVSEYLADGSLAELADVLDVMRALCAVSGNSWDDVERLRQTKAEERGGFERRIVLERTEAR